MPVRGIDEVFPALVEGGAEGEVNEGAPLWAFRFFDEAHAGLGGGAVGLAGIAGDAGADDVFPTGAASVVARHHVIEVEIFTVEHVAAVLTSVAVAFVDVVSGKFDVAPRDAIEEENDDDAGDADAERDGIDHFVFGFTLGERAPAIEIVGEERTVAGLHSMGLSGEQKSEGASSGADVNGLPEAI